MSKKIVCRIIQRFKNYEGVSVDVEELFRIINNERFLFCELSGKIQRNVAKNYRDDYNETTSNNMTISEAINVLLNCDLNDLDRVYYKETGEIWT